MGVKVLLVTLVAVGAGAAWYLQDTPTVRGVTSTVKAGIDKTGIASAVPEALNAKPGTAGLRKCVRGTTVSYVDTPCPPGSKEQPIKQDIVTVVPGQPVAKPASDATTGSDAPKTILERLAPTEKGESLKEKMMNKAIGQ